PPHTVSNLTHPRGGALAAGPPPGPRPPPLPHLEEVNFMPSDHLIPGHGAGWLNSFQADDEQPDHAYPRDLRSGDRTGTPGPGSRIRTRTALFATGAAGTLAVVVLGIGVVVMPINTTSTTPTLASVTTTTPSPTTPQRARACAGLTSHTVTDGAGDTTTTVGVIAKFEHAYYVQRNPEAALALVGPQSGVTREGLTAAIAALPVGVTHCVGISVIAENTAEVHLVELQADGRRLDYLQLVNVAAAPSGLVITNVQKRGS
ncbi:hypothetical protein, partial [Nocardia sp. NPDC058497]|uniref:hypothetical protein n=1 Tax=Nocardia sp. NPDC058497 TaxID=3346529 RepID=UPI00365E9115